MTSDTLSFTIAVVGLVWYVSIYSISLLGCISARRRYRSRPISLLDSAEALHKPGVSILRPLKGLDTNLYENLESTFKQDYPDYEIIFSVADENDQALRIVESLKSRYPNVKVSVIIGEEVVGVNPKVNNLVRSFKMAANDIVWVLDSGVMVDSGTLSRSVNILNKSPSGTKRRIGLVHHVPLALIDETQFGSRLEAAFLNTNHAKMYIAINTVAIESCVVGKSNLYRRSDLNRLDGSLTPIQSQTTRNSGKHGLPAFGRFLAEDNMIASALWHELDLRHDLSCDVARNVVGNMSFSDYVWRRVRWIRVRKRMVLAATVAEPFQESIIVGMIGALSVGALYGFSFWIFIVFHFMAWISIDLDVHSSLSGHGLRQNEWISFFLAWIGRELLALPIWIIAMTGDEVIWRGRRYYVLQNGEAKLVE
ncbi:Ceramide glucosyltransferase [Psilocybe cubensis]|uniref:Ceramide glucosyltransferase n=2 Tax=Psilocybe cubensis TaxID=181762 RepID=A0A8H7YAB6_PSICU|nr:Ceramide glucosyltransferase [Psilocybe cubensis]KAH9486589.1 Ceramide glucosyltransferase [Psilocybe cubensis]